jgi:EAL domain-containing protein (putative c-di-GMP-specific phosphodiesterase class I)
MSHAKSKGTLRYEIFTAQMRAQAEQRVRMEGELRHAVTREDFFVEYQPIVRFDQGRIEGFEALVRWRPEQRDTRYPAQFVESAERIGAIVPIDFKVLESARRAVDAWPSRNGNAVFVAVNMSALHFATRGLAEQLVRAVHTLRFPKDALHIEITETALMRDRDVATETLERLRSEGARVSIDDFGTGYSSLAYVERFHVDALKIDKSFVETMAQRTEAAEIVRAVSALGRALGLEVIAEGVETAEQVELLRDAGVTSGQGFAFSPPVPAESVPQLLECGVALAR